MWVKHTGGAIKGASNGDSVFAARTLVRLFYRCAIQRMAEAKVLRKASYTTGAVYLAGYGVECILKALLLSVVKAGQQERMLQAFRGRGGHDFQWLRGRYLDNGGTGFPPIITRCFSLVNQWNTDLRYVPKTMKPSDADQFMSAAEEIIRWADGRL